MLHKFERLNLSNRDRYYSYLRKSVKEFLGDREDIFTYLPVSRLALMGPYLRAFKAYLDLCDARVKLKAATHLSETPERLTAMREKIELLQVIRDKTLDLFDEEMIEIAEYERTRKGKKVLYDGTTLDWRPFSFGSDNLDAA